MDERDDLAPQADGPGRSALQTVHGAGLLAMIAVLVAVCGLGLQAFLGNPGASDDGTGSDAAPAALPSAAPAAAAAQGYQPPPPLSSPGPDQQAAFLEAVRLSGTGGWSSRLDVLGYGVRACRLLSDGRTGPDVVSALVAAGERPAQAQAVTAAAPQTLCPPDGL
ncbi:DUF732 domain-containing protein [Kineosporia sp. A_224]|uniref:DUF732 domain-containing protein n=1 Tax=Kineosporia sp. A_224 TaxID=1962180 RepID=UPI00130419E5|nr:DUF732 domain-containing protein [Kineosporia sp. A_224]